MIVEVTGLQRPENGLVVPGKFTAFAKSAAIGQKVKEQIVKHFPCQYNHLLPRRS